MAKSKKKKQETNVYIYRMSINIVVAIATLLFAALIPVTWMDKGAWVNGVPLIFLVLIPIVLYFAWVLWQDGKQQVTITRESVHWEKGRWAFRRDVEIPFADVLEFRDCTSIFSVSRKYAIVSNDEKPKRIVLSSAIGGYRDMLNDVLKHLPKGVINARAKRSLTRARFKVND